MGDKDIDIIVLSSDDESKSSIQGGARISKKRKCVNVTASTRNTQNPKNLRNIQLPNSFQKFNNSSAQKQVNVSYHTKFIPTKNIVSLSNKCSKTYSGAVSKKQVITNLPVTSKRTISSQQHFKKIHSLDSVAIGNLHHKKASVCSQRNNNVVSKPTSLSSSKSVGIKILNPPSNSNIFMKNVISGSENNQTKKKSETKLPSSLLNSLQKNGISVSSLQKCGITVTNVVENSTNVVDKSQNNTELNRKSNNVSQSNLNRTKFSLKENNAKTNAALPANDESQVQKDFVKSNSLCQATVRGYKRKIPPTDTVIPNKSLCLQKINSSSENKSSNSNSAFKPACHVVKTAEKFQGKYCDKTVRLSTENLLSQNHQNRKELKISPVSSTVNKVISSTVNKVISSTVNKVVSSTPSKVVPSVKNTRRAVTIIPIEAKDEKYIHLKNMSSNSQKQSNSLNIVSKNVVNSHSKTKTAHNVADSKSTIIDLTAPTNSNSFLNPSLSVTCVNSVKKPDLCKNVGQFNVSSAVDKTKLSQSKMPNYFNRKKESLKTTKKHIDLVNNRETLLSLLALCEPEADIGSSKNTKLKKVVEPVIISIDCENESSVTPKESIKKSNTSSKLTIKLKDVYRTIRHWPKPVVLLERIAALDEHIMINLSEPISEINEIEKELSLSHNIKENLESIAVSYCKKNEIISSDALNAEVNLKVVKNNVTLLSETVHNNTSIVKALQIDNFASNISATNTISHDLCESNSSNIIKSLLTFLISIVETCDELMNNVSANHENKDSENYEIDAESCQNLPEANNYCSFPSLIESVVKEKGEDQSLCVKVNENSHDIILLSKDAPILYSRLSVELDNDSTICSENSAVLDCISYMLKKVESILVFDENMIEMPCKSYEKVTHVPEIISLQYDKNDSLINYEFLSLEDKTDGSTDKTNNKVASFENELHTGNLEKDSKNISLSTEVQEISVNDCDKILPEKCIKSSYFDDEHHANMADKSSCTSDIDGQNATFNEVLTNQVTSPKLSLKRNRTELTPDKKSEEKSENGLSSESAAKRIKFEEISIVNSDSESSNQKQKMTPIISSTPTVSVIELSDKEEKEKNEVQEPELEHHDTQSSAREFQINYTCDSIVPIVEVSDAKKNIFEERKKKFLELMDYSAKLMMEDPDTSEEQKRKIRKIMVNQLKNTDQTYVESENFDLLLDKTLEKLKVCDACDVYVVLNNMKIELKKHKTGSKYTNKGSVEDFRISSNNDSISKDIFVDSVSNNTFADSISLPSKVTKADHSLPTNFNFISSFNQCFKTFEYHQSLQPDPVFCSSLASESTKVAAFNKTSCIDNSDSNLQIAANKIASDNFVTNEFSLSANLPPVSKPHSVEKSLKFSSLKNHTDEKSNSAKITSDSIPSTSKIHLPITPVSKQPVLKDDVNKMADFSSLPSTSAFPFTLSSRSDLFKKIETMFQKKSRSSSSVESSSTDGKKLSEKKDSSTDGRKLAGKNEHNRNKKRIQRLERTCEELHKKIKKLQNKELSLDDLDDEHSSYVQESKYKARFVQVYKVLCKLKKLPAHTGRIVEKKFHYEGSRYKAVNKAVENLINRKKANEKFPDYSEVLSIIKEVDEKEDLGLDVSAEALIVFKDVGDLLQVRRCRDHAELLGCYLTDDLNPAEDPAEHDESLKKKLDENNKMFKDSLNKIIDQYVEKQNSQEFSPKEEENNSHEEEEEEKEADEDDEELKIDEFDDEEERLTNIHNDSDDLPGTAPASPAQNDGTPVVNIVDVDDDIEIINYSDKSTDKEEEIKKSEELSVSQTPRTFVVADSESSEELPPIDTVIIR